MTRKCETCEYASRVSEKTQKALQENADRTLGVYFHCRRSSPSIAAGSVIEKLSYPGQCMAIFPMVGFEDWCGEWKQREGGDA